MNSGRALVTGGTGFLGGRLVEQLILGQGLPVRCLVRDYGKAARLARFALELRHGALEDPVALRRAVQGVDVVYHCAHDFGSLEVNLRAAETLAEACAEEGVRRLVYVSSMAVYHPWPEGPFDETAPSEPSPSDYTEAKRQTEAAILAAGERTGAKVAVIQPTTIYGPYCVAWTIGAAKQLRSGKLVLPRQRIGCCNAVYVDDVVDALLLAADRDEAVGERFLISGPEPVTWHDYYRAYERALGTGSLVLMDDDELERAIGSGAGARARQFRANPKRLLELPLVRRLYDRARGLTGQDLWDRVKDRMPEPTHLPDAAMLAFYRSQGVARTDKAAALLGYQPRFSFTAGMELTAAWLKWAGM